MKLPLIFLTLLSVLAGCAMPEPRRDTARDRIVQELREATRDPKAQEATEKALLPPIAVASPIAKEAEPRFDLSVVNAPVQQVFMAIVNGTRYSMLMTPDVSGNVTINLKDVTVMEALESIRELYGYEYRVQGNRISIQPNTLQTRVFQVNYLAAMRVGEAELRVSSSAITAPNTNTNTNAAANLTQQTTPTTGTPTTGTAAQGLLTSRVRTTSNNDFWGSLTTAITAIVGNAEGRGVVVNPVSGVILVRAFPREIRAAEQYLRAIQAIADRQVMLEAKILEVTLSESFQAGVNWASFNGAHNRTTIGNVQSSTTLQPSVSGTGQTLTGADGAAFVPGVAGSIASAATGGFFGLALQTANFAALINFLETQGSVSVLSSPRVATLNNQKAVLKVGTDELYVTNVTTNTTTNAAGNSTLSPTVTLQPYFSGISLDVTPQIDGEDNIVLHIHPAVTTVSEKEKIIDLGTQGQFKLPLAASTVNETDSIVRARDGYIVAIGGLMSQSSQIDRSGLPGSLGSDSGSLLGQRGRTAKKRELVILLKPTLVKDEKAWAQDVEATLGRIERLGQ